MVVSGCLKQFLILLVVLVVGAVCQLTPPLGPGGLFGRFPPFPPGGFPPFLPGGFPPGGFLPGGFPPGGFPPGGFPPGGFPPGRPFPPGGLFPPGGPVPPGGSPPSSLSPSIRQELENCLGGGNYPCYDPFGTTVICRPRCNSVIDCPYREDENACDVFDAFVTTTFFYETTTTTVSPTSTYTSTLVSTATFTGTETTITTTTSTTTLTSTSTLRASVVYGATALTATNMRVYTVENFFQLVSIPTGDPIAAGIFTCAFAAIPAGGTNFAGGDDYVFLTTMIASPITAAATATCAPIATQYS